MNAPVGLERTRSVIAGAHRGCQWALPIAFGLALTTTLGQALERPLARYLGADAAAVATRDPIADLSVGAPDECQMWGIPASVIHADQPVYGGVAPPS
jgi:hypothetical protein